MNKKDKNFGKIFELNGLRFTFNAKGEPIQLESKAEEQQEEQTNGIEAFLKLVKKSNVKFDVYSIGGKKFVKLHGSIVKGKEAYLQLFKDFTIDTCKLGSGRYGTLTFYYDKTEIGDVDTYLTTHVLPLLTKSK